MADLFFTPSAQRDLRSIWKASANNWGPEQADSYIRDINRHASALGSRPGLGRACFEMRFGYYRFLAGSHVLFYRMNDDKIEIVRILHCRMDFMKHL